MDDNHLLDDESHASVAPLDSWHADVTDVSPKKHRFKRTTAVEYAARYANACSLRAFTVGLALVCTAFLGAINYFELSIALRGSTESNTVHAVSAIANNTLASTTGCAESNAIHSLPDVENTPSPASTATSTESKAIDELPATADDMLASIDFVPNHVIYPPSVFSSSLAEPIALEDTLHQAMLHETCMKHTESIIEWQYALNNNMSSTYLTDRDDPDLYNKIRQCPDVDIFHPGGIRGHGYCEDSVAYLKYLESRLLPQWVLEDSFEDPVSKKKYRYYELCPKTPVIMFNYYWFHDRADWPSTKKLYVMPNIEMGQLQAPQYWSADVILCKTAICARRSTKWFKQNGNPRKTRVFYTRHSSSDIATLAKWRSGEKVVKDFSNVVFVHASGASPFKGTHQVFGCWMSRPDFPPLKVVINRDQYNGNYKQQWDYRVQESNGRVQVHVDGMDAQQYGTLLADTSYMLCPSTMEGYGHYLNQARAAGALIVTTDLPPMNEFLNPESGVLVRVSRRTDPGMLLSGGFEGEHGLKEDEGGLIGDFSAGDLCDAVDRLLKLGIAEREAMAARSRKQYDIDTRFFAARMRELRTFAILEAGRSDDY
ncbi:unnamed protein product [Aphanomyces euteiches]|uniref:Glycosyl transferase family 1 domain-containing protein n=1 Tax=Aphanomyces euteiches TaxID=100861 RepID=A0A6G0X438_9STRA|nr:hypothetical protein Ae201684_008705 [Aphanomyces euteiches]KAH9085387.1 hypothetical protein Ae201684P_005095 [Aphanomyces euteiches]